MEQSIFSLILLFICILCLISQSTAFRLYNTAASHPNGSYPKPFEGGFVGYYGDPKNYQRERINEGAFGTSDQELIYEGVAPRQSCPGMVGPFSDGNYYCSAREFGYCDRRSGTCFCNAGYQGVDCTECRDSHYKIGPHCFPKKLCPDDCNKAGECNYNNGTCTCQPHRTGPSCNTLLCSIHSNLCLTCTETQCLKCAGGYYLTGDTRVCSSCYDFDPRCAGCIKEQGCTQCADSVLTSVRRSGYRSSDPALAPEENSREYSITLPFGTKSAESFSAAETYFVCKSASDPMKNNSITCSQGLNHDESWFCEPFPISHVVCGHYGVFTLLYPNFAISESENYMRMYVQRSGGGFGNVSINYYIKHYTTNDSDVVATAPYTTSQTLYFEDGVVQKSFLITIADDNLVEEDEVFQVVLQTPLGGGQVGAQFRANVTIIDDDKYKISPKLTQSMMNTTIARANEAFTTYIRAKNGRGDFITTGGDHFYAVIENDLASITTEHNPAFHFQRNTIRKNCAIEDKGTGVYGVHCAGVEEQGVYQLRIWNAFPRSIRGTYYSDAFFENPVLNRLDHAINFTWGHGRILPHGSDYCSIRWVGALQTNVSGTYQFLVKADDQARLWIDGNLLLDHFHERNVYLEPSRSIYLDTISLHEIVMEYREVVGDAYAVLMWKKPNKNTFTVVPQDAFYTLYEVDRSPVLVTIQSHDTSANRTECYGNGLYEGIARQRSHFTICPRDIFGNLRNDGDEYRLRTEYFSSTLTFVTSLGYSGGQGEEIVTPRLTYNREIHCYEGVYTPLLAGQYRLNIIYQATPDDTMHHVLGSPFYVTIVPDRAFGPASQIVNLPNPLTMEAGRCDNFTLIMRDAANNLRMQGGDQIEVYMYRVDYYNLTLGLTYPTGSHYPTTRPTAIPTSAPSTLARYNNGTTQKYSDTGMVVMRLGTITDLQNGNYTVQICPVIAGIHEIHVLLGGQGISNQPFRVLDPWLSQKEINMGQGSHYGQYIGSSPQKLIVYHSTASVITTTAIGDGLQHATVGITSHFMITVRDVYDNVLRDQVLKPTITVGLDLSPSATTFVWDYQNGSYLLEYIPEVTGDNLISVYINGFQMLRSPFHVPTIDGKTTTQYTYAVGPGLVKGSTGKVSYFTLYSYDLDGNRKLGYNDHYFYNIHGANNMSNIAIYPCPVPRDPVHPICNATDLLAGYYYGYFTPLYSGISEISIYLSVNGTYTPEVSNSPFYAKIFPSEPKAEFSDVSGTLYDNIAGIPTTVDVQLRDYFRNLIRVGGRNIEVSLIGVGADWGTVEPFTPYQAWANQYNYKGFYYGYPTYYATQYDHQDGTYTFEYNVDRVGLYVLRLSLAEDGLNATYFNDTHFGHLIPRNDSTTGYTLSLRGESVNAGHTISWTGDIGGPASVYGNRASNTYYGKYTSRTESIPGLNTTGGVAARLFPLQKTPTNTNMNNHTTHFRDQYWSVRWTGMITPVYDEVYTFLVEHDDDTTVKLWIGGRGTATNQSDTGTLVIDTSTQGVRRGEYLFTDTKYREIVIDLVHTINDAYFTLSWESLSTPRQVIPSTAFTHWRNISHYNTTIHPNTLCSSCSTAWGDALTQGKVHHETSFLVYARDLYGNLLQRGGDRPSMLAVGKDGIAFRGRVMDYGNSTYRISYYPTQAGTFLMYITVGCCVPNRAVGYPTELDLIAPLLISNTPYTLIIAPDSVYPSKCIAVGNGILGHPAGSIATFTVYYHDIYHNPTMLTQLDELFVTVTFHHRHTGDLLLPVYYEITARTLWNISFAYQVNTAGEYDLSIMLSTTNHNLTQAHILSSPFPIIIAPIQAYFNHTIARGQGIRQASPYHPVTFEIQLYDTMFNKLLFGGNVFYIRVVGDRRFNSSAHSSSVVASATSGSVVGSLTSMLHSALTVLPQCVDTQNGRYQCSYQPHHPGKHYLYIRVLSRNVTITTVTSTTTQYPVNVTSKRQAESWEHSPGGSGLYGEYFNTVDGANRMDAVPITQQVDAVIAFQWKNGWIPTLLCPGIVQDPDRPDIISDNISDIVGHAGQLGQLVGQTFNAETGHRNVLRMLGQSIRWSGYLVGPRTDQDYLISMDITDRTVLNVTIFLDQQLVFDSYRDIQETVSLIAYAAYEIRILASTAAAAAAADSESSVLGLQLLWSSTSMRRHPIASYYLFPTAQEIPHSPFPVEVM